MLNNSIASLNSTTFLNKTGLALKINTGHHNLSACPGAIPAHLASKLKQIPTENIKIQSGHILAYFNQTSRLVISKLRLTKQHPRSTVLEFQVPSSDQHQKLTINNFCIVNSNLVVAFSGSKVILLKNNGNLDFSAGNDNLEFINAENYQGYVYLTTKCGCLFKLDMDTRNLIEIGEIDDAKPNPNVSIFSRMTSSFFAASTKVNSTLIDTDYDNVLRTCFYMDFAYLVTKTKIVRIDINDGKRKEWKLNSENLQIFDGCVLGTKIFILTGISATSCPEDLKAIDLDFDRPNPAIYTSRLTRDLNSMIDSKCGEMKIIPLKSVDDSTTHEICVYGGDQINLVNVEINLAEQEFQKKENAQMPLECNEFLVSCGYSLENTNELVFYALNVGVLKLNQISQVQNTGDNNFGEISAINNTTFMNQTISASFLDTKNDNNLDLTKVQSSGSNFDKIKASFSQYIIDRLSKARQLLQNFDQDDVLEMSILSVAEEILCSGETTGKSKFTMNILKEKVVLMERFEKFLHDCDLFKELSPEFVLKLLSLNSTCVISLQIYSFYVKKMDQTTNNDLQRVLKQAGFQNIDNFFRNPAKLKQLLTLIQTKLPLESSLKLTDLISKSYLTFRSKKATIFNSSTSKTQEIPGFIFDFRSRQTVEFFHHFYELTLTNNLDKTYIQNAVKFAEIVLQYKLDEENSCSNLNWLVQNYQPSVQFCQIRSKYVTSLNSLNLAEKFCDFEFLLKYCCETDNKNAILEYVAKYEQSPDFVELVYTYFRSNEHNNLGGKAFLVEILKEIQACTQNNTDLSAGILELGQLLANDPEIACVVEEVPIHSFKSIAMESKVEEMSIKKKLQFTSFAMIAELAAGAETPSDELNSQFELLDCQINTFPDRDYNYHVRSLNLIEELTNPDVSYSKDVSDYLKSLKLVKLIQNRNEFENELDICKNLQNLPNEDIIPVLTLRIFARAINLDSWKELTENECASDDERVSKCQGTMFAKLIYNLRDDDHFDGIECCEKLETLWRRDIDFDFGMREDLKDDENVKLLILQIVEKVCLDRSILEGSRNNNFDHSDIDMLKSIN